MASTLSFTEYVCEQVSEAGHITFKKMFGEYAIYCDEKVVAFVCDNQLFVKPTAAGRAKLGAPVEAPPYPGAKLYFLIDGQLDDRQFISSVIALTANELPMPTPKKPKAIKNKETKTKAVKPKTTKAKVTKPKIEKI